MKERSAWLNPRVWGSVILFLVIFGVLSYFRGIGSTFVALVTLLEVVLLFNLLIIVHELGHFLAARWRGLKADKFAIWFGKPIWKKNIDGVDYILGSIPAGGYVSLPQMAPMETIEGKSDTPREELPPASPGDKIIVAFAGPLFSFLLALFFATIVWIVGKPTTYSENTNIIGFVYPNGPAYKAGIRDGDAFKTINGLPVRRWYGVPDGVTWRLMTSKQGEAIPIVVERDGKEHEFSVRPEVDPDAPKHKWYQRSVPPKIMVAPAEQSIVIGKIYENGPAALAGLKEGDQIMALDGIKLLSSGPVNQQVKEHPDAPVHLTILRDGKTFDVALRAMRPASPEKDDDGKPFPPFLGYDQKGDSDILMIHPDPWTQVTQSANAVRGTLAALLTPHSNVSASQLSGPVGIMNIFYMVLSSENGYGWRIALWLAVLINVNLAMLNLFPLPVLDGGHILLSCIEWVRRRQLSMTILEPLQTVCAVLLISYMAYITFFDAQDSSRLVTSGGPPPEIKFAPPKQLVPN